MYLYSLCWASSSMFPLKTSSLERNGEADFNSHTDLSSQYVVVPLRFPNERALQCCEKETHTHKIKMSAIPGCCTLKATSFCDASIIGFSVMCIISAVVLVEYGNNVFYSIWLKLSFISDYYYLHKLMFVIR